MLELGRHISSYFESRRWYRSQILGVALSRLVSRLISALGGQFPLPGVCQRLYDSGKRKVCPICKGFTTLLQGRSSNPSYRNGPETFGNVCTNRKCVAKGFAYLEKGWSPFLGYDPSVPPYTLDTELSEIK